MTPEAWDLACVSCSAGWAVCLASAWVLCEVGKSKIAAAAVAVLLVVGAGSCAAEDRVCEMAAREASP